MAATQQTADHGAGSTAQATRRAQIYRIAGLDKHAYKYDAKAEIQGYVDLVADSYTAATSDAQSLKAAVSAFLAAPGDETLATARDAWMACMRQALADVVEDAALRAQLEAAFFKTADFLCNQ